MIDRKRARFLENRSSITRNKSAEAYANEELDPAEFLREWEWHFFAPVAPPACQLLVTEDNSNGSIAVISAA